MGCAMSALTEDNIIILPTVKGGLLIKTARQIRGYSQEELAHLYGISDRTIRNWEKEKTEPGFSIVVDMLKFLGLTFNDVNEVISHAA